jgi:hypothetical protein
MLYRTYDQFFDSWQGSATLHTVQLTYVQRIYQLYFLIHYCCARTEHRLAFGSATL